MICRRAIHWLVEVRYFDRQIDISVDQTRPWYSLPRSPHGQASMIGHFGSWAPQLDPNNRVNSYMGGPASVSTTSSTTTRPVDAEANAKYGPLFVCAD